MLAEEGWDRAEMDGSWVDVGWGSSLTGCVFLLLFLTFPTFSHPSSSLFLPTSASALVTAGGGMCNFLPTHELSLYSCSWWRIVSPNVTFLNTFVVPRDLSHHSKPQYYVFNRYGFYYIFQILRGGLDHHHTSD